MTAAWHVCMSPQYISPSRAELLQKKPNSPTHEYSEIVGNNISCNHLTPPHRKRAYARSYYDAYTGCCRCPHRFQHGCLQLQTKQQRGEFSFAIPPCRDLRSKNSRSGRGHPYGYSAVRNIALALRSPAWSPEDRRVQAKIMKRWQYL